VVFEWTQGGSDCNILTPPSRKEILPNRCFWIWALKFCPPLLGVLQNTLLKFKSPIMIITDLLLPYTW
jgi:hypothetical protein